MLKANAPSPFVLPFAGSASATYRNTIPVPSQTGITPGAASYTDGFPPVTMEPIASGGIPPFGADMNGILYAATLANLWQQSGYLYSFDSAFASNANINGYPAGALLSSSTVKCLWLSQVDGNTTDPGSTASSGWVSIFPNAGSINVGTTGGTSVLTPNLLNGPLIAVTGTLASNAVLQLPLVAGMRFSVQNGTTGAFTLTVQGATGSGAVIPQGANAPQDVLCDGTNWYSLGLSGGPYLPLSGTAVAATKLATPRIIAIGGLATAAGAGFDGTGNITLNVTALNVPVALGYTPANNGLVMHLAGAETATGVKTFPQTIVTPTSDPDTRGCLVKPVGSTAYAALGAITAYGAYVTANLYYDGSWHLVDTSKKGAYLGIQWSSGTFYFGTSPSGTASVTNVMSVDIAGNATFNGTVLSAGYDTSSDPRLKDNLRPQALCDVSMIGLWTWDWSTVSRRTGQGAGVRSDEVRAVFPQCVRVDDEGFDVVDYGKLGVHLSVTAVRRMHALEKRLAELEMRL